MIFSYLKSLNKRMPKNLKKKANKDKARRQTGDTKKRELPFATDCQVYGKCLKPCGDRRFEVECVDGETRICRLRGSIRKRKKSWCGKNQWVIVALRDFQESKGDIIIILTDNEVKRLRELEELEYPADDINEKGDDDLGIDFVFDFNDI
jgi:translation initiation factor 1A